MQRQGRTKYSLTRVQVWTQHADTGSGMHMWNRSCCMFYFFAAYTKYGRWCSSCYNILWTATDTFHLTLLIKPMAQHTAINISIGEISLLN